MSEPGIKLWVEPVKAPGDMIKKSCNLKGSLLFPPYHCTDAVKEFYGCSNIQRGREYYQEVIHNKYHCVNIETYHQVICLIPEGIARHFVSPKCTASGIGTLR